MVSGGWQLDQRLVLTVATGRCGTGYFGHLLADQPGICSLHEPEPMFSRALWAVRRCPSLAAWFWLAHKLPFIRAQKESTYFETSHLTCKGFLEPLFDNDVRFDLVIIDRDPIQVATSMYLLNAIPGRSRLGKVFLLAPDDPGVLPLPDWDTYDDWSLCYWYCREIERRKSDYGALVVARGGTVLRTSIEAMTTPDGIAAFARFFEIHSDRALTSKFEARLRAIVNARQSDKSAMRYAAIRHLNLLELARRVDHQLGFVPSGLEVFTAVHGREQVPQHGTQYRSQ